MEMERGPFKLGFGSGCGLWPVITRAGWASRVRDVPRFFVKFDKIRSFWVFLGRRSECMGFGFLRRSAAPGKGVLFDVRLSLRKAACSSMAPPSSTGNPGSVYTNCETAIRSEALWGCIKNPAARRDVCGWLICDKDRVGHRTAVKLSFARM
jgi:hypothetical protein